MKCRHPEFGQMLARFRSIRNSSALTLHVTAAGSSSDQQAAGNAVVGVAEWMGQARTEVRGATAWAGSAALFLQAAAPGPSPAPPHNPGHSAVRIRPSTSSQFGARVGDRVQAMSMEKVPATAGWT